MEAQDHATLHRHRFEGRRDGTACGPRVLLRCGVLLDQDAVDNVTITKRWTELSGDEPSNVRNAPIFAKISRDMLKQAMHVCTAGRAHPEIAVDDLDGGEAVDLRRVLQCVLQALARSASPAREKTDVDRPLLCGPEGVV